MTINSSAGSNGSATILTVLIANVSNEVILGAPYSSTRTMEAKL